MAKKSYEWKYCSLGGMTRVKIENGEDIRHLGELDPKLWTVLSCPVSGLEFPEKTLKLIDKDNDGKIRVREIVECADWLCKVLSNPDILLEKKDSIALSDFNCEDAEGKNLYNSAKQILSNLGLEKEEISISDTADIAAIFSKTQFNGDGIITCASTDDEKLKALISNIIACVGATKDRSGDDGVNADQINAFYAACADYAAWKDAEESGKADIYPFADKSEEALAACEAINAKLNDWFTRCKLAAFNNDSLGSLDVSGNKIAEIADLDLGNCNEQIASYPVAHINTEGILSFSGINPAWKSAVEKVQKLVFADKESISETEWKEAMAKFGALKAWKAAKKGEVVEGLGIEAVRTILAENKKAELEELVAKDSALLAEATAIDTVDKLLWLRRDFCTLLNNYVSMPDFYNSWKGESKAIFQAGTLFIDQRALDLCIRVSDMSKQADMAGLSGMYIIYCNCTSKTKGQTMTIAAVLTDGEVDNLRVGQNAIFYDRNGLDWDAIVTKIIDNPTSIRQAFWSPYRKLGNTIQERINKSAMEKEKKVNAGLNEKANTAQVNPANGAAAAVPQQKFDIAKFAGIFAAIGMGVGFVGSALMALITPWYNIFIAFFFLVVVISGPSMFLAWLKLRKRNLGPVLNANGWAINSRLIVNIKFGATLTKLAKYPKVVFDDPFSEKEPAWKKAVKAFIAVLLVAGGLFAGHYFKGWFGTWKPVSPKISAQIDSIAKADSVKALTAAEPVQEAE